MHMRIDKARADEAFIERNNLILRLTRGKQRLRCTDSGKHAVLHGKRLCKRQLAGEYLAIDVNGFHSLYLAVSVCRKIFAMTGIMSCLHEG